MFKSLNRLFIDVYMLRRKKSLLLRKTPVKIVPIFSKGGIK